MRKKKPEPTHKCPLCGSTLIVFGRQFGQEVKDSWQCQSCACCDIIGREGGRMPIVLPKRG